MPGWTKTPTSISTWVSARSAAGCASSACSSQDSWRARSNLTVNAGLRYELQRPFYALNNSYATATVEDVWGVSGVGNLFMPGVMTGKKPTFTGYGKGEPAYDTDYNNFAPTLGLAWVPGPREGLIGRLLGSQDGDSVFRAGYSLAYNRPGMSDFSDVFGTNPGITLDATRNVALSNLNADGRGYPCSSATRSRLGPPSNIPVTQQYPFTEVITGDLNIFDPALQVPYSQTWTASWGRKISSNIGVDVRYVGTRHLQGWVDYNYNESEHHRERLPRRVPEGTGQPAGEHRGRPRQQRSRTRAPPARHRCRSTWPT